MREIKARTVVVGSGCAGLNAADTLAANLENIMTGMNRIKQCNSILRNFSCFSGTGFFRINGLRDLDENELSMQRLLGLC